MRKQQRAAVLLTRGFGVQERVSQTTTSANGRVDDSLSNGIDAINRPFWCELVDNKIVPSVRQLRSFFAVFTEPAQGFG